MNKLTNQLLARAARFALVPLSLAVSLEAHAATCTFAADTGVVTVALSAEAATIKVNLSTGAILLNGQGCGSANRYNAKSFYVSGTAGAEYLTVDFNGAPFRRMDSTHLPITGDLGAGKDMLIISGTAQNDHFVIGQNGVDWDGDLMPCISIANLETIRVLGLNGDDLIEGQGGGGLGGPATIALDLQGGNGNDRLIGGEGNDVLSGGAGNDYLDGMGGADVVNGGDGNDVVHGGAGNDRIWGTAGNDQLYGDDGDDTFFEEAVINGSDTMFGGDGIDTVSYVDRPYGVNVTLDGVADSGYPGEFDTVMPDVENVIGGHGNDTITGNDLANKLMGGDGDDVIHGGGGDDVILGNAGNDKLYGDDGDDTFDEEKLANGADQFWGGEGVDTVTYAGRTAALNVSIDGFANDGAAGEHDNVELDVENLVGGSAADVLTGSDADNEIQGGAGNDVIHGLGGNDVIWGGAGNDKLYGDDGWDLIMGDDGDDLIVGGAYYDDLYGGNGNDTIYGGNEDGSSAGPDDCDFIYGGPGNDKLYGGDGDDALMGEAGNDLMDGGAGDDQILGGQGLLDVVICGPGNDWMQDLDGATATPDCESISIRP